jgi:hypothetical protein
LSIPHIGEIVVSHGLLDQVNTLFIEQNLSHSH